MVRFILPPKTPPSPPSEIENPDGWVVQYLVGEEWMNYTSSNSYILVFREKSDADDTKKILQKHKMVSRVVPYRNYLDGDSEKT